MCQWFSRVEGFTQTDSGPHLQCSANILAEYFMFFLNSFWNLNVIFFIFKVDFVSVKAIAMVLKELSQSQLNQ